MIGIDAAVLSIWIHRRWALIWALTGTISEIYRAHRPLSSLPGDPPALRRGLNARRIQQWQAVSRDITRHFSAPLGVRQRLAAHDSSPGGCRMPGLQRRHQTKGLWRLDISPKVLSPASERVAVLGRYALGQPGDCMWPDNRYLASGERNVKSRQIVQRAKRQSR
jgi:hypothetical protein